MCEAVLSTTPCELRQCQAAFFSGFLFHCLGLSEHALSTYAQ